MSFTASGMPSNMISIPNGCEVNCASHPNPNPNPKCQSQSSLSGTLTPPVSILPTLSSNLHSCLCQQSIHNGHVQLFPLPPTKHVPPPSQVALELCGDCSHTAVAVAHIHQETRNAHSSSLSFNGTCSHTWGVVWHRQRNRTQLC